MKSLTVTALTTLALVASASLSEARCVRYEGIVHCPIEEATLKLSKDGSRLAVLGLSPEGDDGVRSHLESANLWAATVRMADVEVGDELTLSAVAAGSTVSDIRYRVVSGGLQAMPRFTGAVGLSSYWLYLFDDDEEVPEGPGGYVPGTRIDIDFVDIVFPPVLPDPEGDDTDVDHGFGNDGAPDAVAAGLHSNSRLTKPGTCVWQAKFRSRVRVRVDGKVIGEGDEILLVEKIDGSGNYPYTVFDALELRSSVGAFALTAETSISNGF